MHHGKKETCEQMYGFLPCSKSVPGHLFLILVYEYLLFHGESYLASGGERIFKILGPGVFGASAFQVIGSLPEALILLASGLWSNEETAQECVLTGVGLLAGSTILLLTLIWGTCVILGSQDFHKHLHSNPSEVTRKQNPIEKLFFSLWPSYGVLTDLGTSYIARIMLLSVVPMAVIQIPRIFGFSSVGKSVFVLISLVVSVVFLLGYFFYQFFKPWIQRRRLLYIKHEHLVLDILKHVQKQTKRKLLTDNGAPNVTTIRRLFEEGDNDGDKVISFHELKKFLKEIKCQTQNSDEDKTTEEMMKEFDIDNDEKISMNEFVNGMTKWLNDTKTAMTKRYHSVKSLKDMYLVLKPWIQKKREEREMMRHLIPDILEHLQNSVYGSLLTDDGTPDIPAIKRLFKDIDLNKDNRLSYFELKELMTNINFGISPYDPDIAASKIMEELDISGDQLISEKEFVTGLSKWLNCVYNLNHSSDETEDDNYQKTWEQMDKLIDDKFVDKSPLAWIKALSLLVLGIVMLGVLAEPLTHSVRDFSAAASVPSFYVSFVFIPLATNARIAVSAINEARKKKLHTTSLTLSEIYGTVFMNNILGFAVLVSLIYFRGLSWTFSTEVLMVLLVSVIMGCLGSFITIFPVWTSFLAYMLYPLSLILVYVLGESKWLSSNLNQGLYVQ
ncbi:Calmodulin and related proteins (EF-Hand superfamily) [Handroanthus impetiginosus]|uniref:Calmodulin and related proteins (EF-Hand superfamily) n=2 Tax=Handroanthus impetiginosus TaxID=429701 RepID=A0A2G9HEQ8_9LAMI|nr:Calmodulin and related proteins (EF-Hand superfamily) [Handroanthus impetiginosus]